jgi:hypothetical protein
MFNYLDGTVDLVEYNATHDGMTQSWVERFPAEFYLASVDPALQELYERDLPFFAEVKPAKRV